MIGMKEKPVAATKPETSYIERAWNKVSLKEWVNVEEECKRSKYGIQK